DLGLTSGICLSPSSGQMPVIAKLDQLFISLPDSIRNLLLDLKSQAWIKPDALKIADHNVDDLVFGNCRGRIFRKRDGGRGGNDPFARPALHKLGPGSALHVRLLDEDKTAGVHPPCFEQPAAESDVFSGIG